MYTGNIKFERSTTVPATDEFIMAGKAWRIGQYFPAVPINGSAYITFKTPVNLVSLYQVATIGKTGGEARITLIEVPTLTGTQVTLTPYNINRNYRDKVCELTNVTSGVSTTLTVTGGLYAPYDYIPGENQGGQRQAGSSTAGDFLPLLHDTLYVLRVWNIGTSTSNINVLFKMAVGV
jgi:hypothetical protein